jgi:Protein of unknown function (DUF2752)
MRLPGRALDLGLAGLAATQLAAAAWLVPAGDARDRVALPGGAPLRGMCLFHEGLDLDCPMCGMTRSFVALAHGDLAAALRFHPAGPLLFVAMAVLVAAVAIAALRRARPLVERRRFMIAFEAVALACLVIGVFKTVRS